MVLASMILKSYDSIQSAILLIHPITNVILHQNICAKNLFDNFYGEFHKYFPDCTLPCDKTTQLRQSKFNIFVGLSTVRKPDFFEVTIRMIDDAPYLLPKLSKYQHDFKEVKSMGKGAFGNVFKVKDRFNNKEYAIKKVYLKNNPDDWCQLTSEDTLSLSPTSTLVNSYDSNASKRLSISQDPKLVREVKALASVSDHPNIVRYYNAWIEDDDTAYEYSDFEDSDDDEAHVAILYIQMELYSSYTLRDYLDGRTEIDREANLRILKQLVEAVAHIHSRKVIHLDIKPENIFIKGHNVHLGDFGLAKDFMEANTHEPIFGTVFYTPPEKQSSYKYDIYSLGIILFELFVLFKTRMERADILTSLTTKNQIPALMKQLYPDVASLVSQLISIHPDKRLSAIDIKENPIFYSSLSAGGRIQGTDKNVFVFNFEKEIKRRESLTELSTQLKGTNTCLRSANSVLESNTFQHADKLTVISPTFKKQSYSLLEQPTLISLIEKSRDKSYERKNNNRNLTVVVSGKVTTICEPEYSACDITDAISQRNLEFHSKFIREGYVKNLNYSQKAK